MAITNGVARHATGKVTLLVLMVFVYSTEAAITFQGTVSPLSSLENGAVSGVLEVGVGNDPNSVNPRSIVHVDGGSLLETGQTYVGADEGFFGRLLIEGTGTLFTIGKSGTTSEPSLQIGRKGDGHLSLTGGAELDLSNSQGDLSIGDNVSGYGTVVVSGDYTLMTIGQNLIVGNAGVGSMEIRDGALVRTLDNSLAGVTIGAKNSGFGLLLVEGQFSRLLVGDDLTIGDQGAGVLTISKRAVVDADSPGNKTKIGLNGRVVLNDGTLLFDSLVVQGVLEGQGLLRGDGLGNGVVSIRDTGRVTSSTGQLLQFMEDVNNQGTVDVEGGEIEFLDTFSNKAIGTTGAPGRIALEGGRVRFSKGLTNWGVISIVAGASDLHGKITNETGASILVARNSVATFHDAFTDNGGTLTVLAGGNALFLTDVSLQSSSVLAITLEQNLEAPLGEGTPLSVAGHLNLEGALNVSVEDNLSVAEGDIYTLLSAEAVSGVLNSALIPDLPGDLEFELISTPVSLLLLVQSESEATLAGDFNFDGTVNEADYAEWRTGFGTIYTEEDYYAWVKHYDYTIVSTTLAASALVAVPETDTRSLVLGMICVSLICRSRINQASMA